MRHDVKTVHQFKEQYKSVMKEAKVAFEDSPWENKDFYACWAEQSYYFLCHATRLLCLAAARFTVKDDALHLRCVNHSVQEMRHETLALNDLKSFGLKPGAYGELPDTAQLYQSQYYLIEHENAAALFGSVIYLEGLSIEVGKDLYKRTLKAHSEKAVSFLKVHVNEDEDHIEAAFKSLKEMSQEQIQSTWWSFIQNHVIYLNMLTAIRARSVSKPPKTVKAA